MFSRLAAWSQQASDLEAGIAIAALAAVALAGLYLGLRQLRKYRLIEDTPTSRIRSAAQGYVEFQGVGRQMDGPPIIAPLSRRPCVWYRYRVEHRSRSARSSHWRTVESDTSESLFLIDDGSGSCVVDPDGAQVIPRYSRTWYGSSRHPAEPPAWSSWLGGLFSSYRYWEELIPVGGAVYALGLFRTHGGSAHEISMAEDVRDLLRAWKRDGAELLRRFDSDSDGRVDLREWEKARRDARKQVMQERSARAAEPAIHTLSNPAVPGQPYVLAGIAEDVLVNRYRVQVVLGIFGFFVFGGLVSYLMSVRIAG